jgi:GLPGLI family protein
MKINKNLLVILFLIVYKLSNSQNKTIIVTYDVLFAKENFFENSPLKNEYSKFIDKKSNINFELIISNDSISSFKIIENLTSDVDKNKMKMFKLFSSYNGEILSDIKNKRVYVNYANQIGDYYVEKKVQEYEWEITNETKLIENYTCYKAIGKEKIENPKGTFTNLITVWFAPEIPIQSGPFTFSGLPGLILELNRKSVTFGVSKIYIKKESDININLPNTSKVITEEKLIEMRNKFLEE